MAPVALLLTLCWIAFCWPWLSGRYTIPWDAKAHFLPQVQFLAASLARGEWPFWTPHVFAGHPQVADPQSMIFSPPMLLLALIDSAPSLRAVDTTVLLTVLFGGLGIALLCRDLGWHWVGSAVAAVAFQFGGAMAWRIQHYGQVMSLAYLPFALFLLGRALERSSAGYGAAAGVVASFILLGRDQVGLIGLYLLAGYVVWHWLRSGALVAAILSSLRPLGCAAAAGAVLCIIPMLFTLLLAAQSNRPSIDFIGAGRGSLHPALAITAAVPHLFGAAGQMERYWGPPSFTWTGTDLFIAQNVGQLYLGAIPLLLLLIGAARGVLWAREIRFFTLAAIVCVLYALGWYTPFFRAAYEVLPGVSLFRRPADAVFLVGGVGALLAGYVAHRMFSGTLPPAGGWRQKTVPLAALVALGLVAIGFAARWGQLDRVAKPLLMATVSIALAALALKVGTAVKTARPVVAGGLVVAMLTADLSVNNGPNGATAMPPAELAMLEPRGGDETIELLKRKVAATRTDTRRDRIEMAGLGFHWPNASLTHGLEHTLGYNPVRLRLYSEASGAQDTVGLPEQRRFSPLFPSYRSQLADLLSLRFIATGVPIENIDSMLGPGDMILVARTRDAYVYENTRALPRVLFAHTAREANFESMLATGTWPSVDLATTVLLETLPPPKVRRPGTARILSYANTDIKIEVDSPDGGWVVLSDTWHPWWFAEIDHLPAPVIRANVLFRAVQVPSGRHTVRFVFRPLAGALREVFSNG